jgi:hypothetical protein
MILTIESKKFKVWNRILMMQIIVGIAFAGIFDVLVSLLKHNFTFVSKDEEDAFLKWFTPTMIGAGFVFGWIFIRVSLLSIICYKVELEEASGFWLKSYLLATFSPLSIELFEVLASAYPIEPL